MRKGQDAEGSSAYFVEGANKQYRKVSGPAAEVKEGFAYSLEMPTAGAAFAADINICSAQSELGATGKGQT